MYSTDFIKNVEHLQALPLGVPGIFYMFSFDFMLLKIKKNDK